MVGERVDISAFVADGAHQVMHFHLGQVGNLLVRGEFFQAQRAHRVFSSR